MLLTTTGLLFGLIALAIPIAAVLALLAVTLGAIYSPMPLHLAMGDILWTNSIYFILIAVPLFILMGELLLRAGIAARMYRALALWMGWLPGGLMHSNIGACTLFAATSGSSIATAATVGTVAIPEAKRDGYNESLFMGTLAAGGTLGILIPPSTGFVIYAVLSEQSIGRLFLAGVIPGILLLLMFMATVYLLCTLRPGMGPRGPSTTLAEKSRAIVAALPIIILTLLTIGGIYGGFFSPSEAAGVGAGAVIAYGLVTGTLTLRELWGATRDSIVTSSAVMLILIAAHIFNPFLALSHIPELVSNAIGAMDLGRIGTLLVILVIYMALGTFLEGFAMLVLTLPIFVPIVSGLGIDLIWFGVLVVLTLEMGLISPPVGINVFIVKSVAPRVPLADIFRGVFPFWLAMLVTLLILVAIPALLLYLPTTMMQ